MNKISDFPSWDNKKILFLSETHFQFMNCINIAVNTSNSECDLFINEMYKDVKDYADRIRRLGVFNKVKTYNVTFGKAKKTIKFLFMKKYISEQFKHFDYDVVLFASRDFLARCVVTYCKYISPSTKLISYDEGLGTYISRMESYTNAAEKLIITAKYHDDAKIVTDKILYKPEAYIGESENITLYRMPRIDGHIISLFNRLYAYEESMQLYENVIYFDNYYDGKDTNKRRVIESLYRITNGRFIIKKHPQTPSGAYDRGNIYQYTNIPYEIIAVNDKYIEDKTLITIMSTAVWTPILMFGKYPQIILLYPLFDNGEVNDAKKIIEKMISLYPKDRITVIDNYEELEKLRIE